MQPEVRARDRSAEAEGFGEMLDPLALDRGVCRIGARNPGASWVSAGNPRAVGAQSEDLTGRRSRAREDPRRGRGRRGPWSPGCSPR
eukprot:3678080-Rhodomonas_salina.2